MNILVQEKKQLIENAKKLVSQKVLIVGDVGLDRYVMGSVKRISPEAPVPIVEVDQQDARLGLSSNVAANIASLGSHAFLVGVVGRDDNAEEFRGLLKKAKVSPDYLIVDESRPTTTKLRVLSGHHHIVRVDFERRKFLSADVERRLLDQVKQLLPQVSALVIEDYAKGVLSEKLSQELIALAKRENKIVTCDPNRATPASFYRGVDYMTPNTDEALALSGFNDDPLRPISDTFEEVGVKLLSEIQAKAVIVTRGKDGMSIFEKGGKMTHVPTFARAVFDVTGAGDTVIATLTAALCAGLEIKNACMLSNYAAGIVVGRAGCVTTNVSEIQQYIESFK